MDDNENVNQPPTTNNLVWLDWPAPSAVKACYSLRSGGYSNAPYSSFNFGDHVEDLPANVEKNRKRLQEIIGQQEIVWLQQVHGTNIVGADCGNGQRADACYTKKLNQVCNVMTADCLPVFFCDTDGSQVAMAHAGWRGLHAGVLAQTLKQFNQFAYSGSKTSPKAQSSNNIIAYLGPAISQAAFEVGNDVRDAFLSLPHDQLKQGRQYFKAGRFLNTEKPNVNNDQKWMADLYGIAKDMLNNMGVSEIYGGDRCTYTEADDFFSYRRDGITGRMANLIWLD
jgi:YfiH family protein